MTCNNGNDLVNTLETLCLIYFHFSAELQVNKDIPYLWLNVFNDPDPHKFCCHSFSQMQWVEMLLLYSIIQAQISFIVSLSVLDDIGSLGRICDCSCTSSSARAKQPILWSSSPLWCSCINDDWFLFFVFFFWGMDLNIFG